MPVALSTDTTKSSWCCANELNSEPFSFLIRSLLFPAKMASISCFLETYCCFFSCAIKKEASSISFGDASHAYVKLLYARERVEMQAGRRGKGSSTNVRNTGLNISLSYQSSQRTTKYYCCSNNYFFYSKANPKLMLSLQPIRKLIETDVFIQLHYYCTL